MSVRAPPFPLVNVPLLRQYAGLPPKPVKRGRGYSVAEVRAVGLTVQEARLLGIYVDERRKSLHEDNVKRLIQWLKAVAAGTITPPPPKLSLTHIAKLDRGRAFKGKTMAGRKARGLLSLKYRYTHHYKWSRKQRERELRKRHEATRHKGGD